MKHTLFIKITLIFLLVLILPGLTACQKGPTSDSLKTEIQNKLDTRFQAGLFTITWVGRNGSYPYTEEDNTPHLLVYYRARIEFLKDYSLSEWDKLNASALSSVLGATRHGIDGINSKGNKKGDVLKVYGTSSYVLQDNKWIASNHLTPQKTSKLKKPTFEEKTFVDTAVEELSSKLKLYKKKNKNNHLKVMNDELKTSLKALNLKLDQLDGIITLTTGVKMGEYFAIGQGLEKVLSQHKKELHNYASNGSMENCRLVNDRQANFGICQNDIAYMAVQGGHVFKEDFPQKNLRAVCTLYPEAIQIITLKSSSIRNIGDLKGKKINAGPVGSGTRVNALQILKSHGFEKSDFSTLENMDFKSAVEALKNGEIDVFFSTWAYPSRLVEELAAVHPLHFLSIEPLLITDIKKELPYLIPMTIPKFTYNGQDQDIQTIGVTAMLITHDKTPDNQVKILLDALFNNSKILSNESMQANYISPKTATIGVSITMHPRAVLYFDELKMAKENQTENTIAE